MPAGPGVPRAARARPGGTPASRDLRQDRRPGPAGRACAHGRPRRAARRRRPPRCAARAAVPAPTPQPRAAGAPGLTGLGWRGLALCTSLGTRPASEDDAWGAPRRRGARGAHGGLWAAALGGAGSAGRARGRRLCGAVPGGGAARHGLAAPAARRGRLPDGARARRATLLAYYGAWSRARRQLGSVPSLVPESAGTTHDVLHAQHTTFTQLG